MANIEITLEELREDDDWAEVFADENSGNVSKVTRVAPLESKVSDAEFSRSDVQEIIAAVNGENDGEEWIGVFLLHDGRYAVAQGGCDYTGWDCQAGNNLTLCSSMNDVLRYGLTEEERGRLGL